MVRRVRNNPDDGLAPPTDIPLEDVVVSVDLGTQGIRVGVWANGKMSNVNIWPNHVRETTNSPNIVAIGPSGIVTGRQALNDADVSGSKIIRNVILGFFDNSYFRDSLVEIKEALAKSGDPFSTPDIASILKRLLSDIWAGTEAYLTVERYQRPRTVCFTTPIGTTPDARRTLVHAAADAGFPNPTTSDCDHMVSRLCYMIHDSWMKGDGASKKMFGKDVALFDCGYGMSVSFVSRIISNTG